MSVDIVIMGAGVAGCSAAVFLSESKLSVELLDRGAAKPPSGYDWVGAPVVPLLEKLGLAADKVLGRPFAGARFYSMDFKKTIESPAADAPGYRVDYPQFVAELRKRARRAGAGLVTDVQIGDIEPGEEAVSVQLADAAPVAGRFMLHAEGGAALPDPLWQVQVVVPVAKSAADDWMYWVVQRDEQIVSANWWYDDGRLIVNVYRQGQREEALAAFREVVAAAIKAGKLPGQANDSKIEPHYIALPGRHALEIDSHVDKRSLLIGGAGGFLSAAGQEGIYPAVWSAELAAQTLADAAGARHPQDVLRGYSALWRTTMADYLRRPNTDVHFLLSLVFTNQQMADRMAAALWAGENI